MCREMNIFLKKWMVKIYFRKFEGHHIIEPIHMVEMTVKKSFRTSIPILNHRIAFR